MNTRPSGVLPEAPWSRLSVGHYDSFLIRVFSRPPHDTDVFDELVQGEITHIATRRRVRFADMQRAIAFICEQLARSGVRSKAAEEASCE